MLFRIMHWNKCLLPIFHYHIRTINAISASGPTIHRLLFPVEKPQKRGYAVPGGKGRRAPGIVLPPDQEESFVEADTNKLCTNVCVNYRTDVESDGPEIKPDSEYPDWLFTLDLDPDKDLEDLDPERDGWKYWEKWEQRRQDQIHLHNKLKYKYFWLQNSPSVELMLRYTKYKEREHKFHIMPNTTPVFQKSTRKRRLQERHWTSLEEPEVLMEDNG